jgi:isoamylase
MCYTGSICSGAGDGNPPFWRGDEGMAGLFASRICGSSDLYQSSGKGPECSINFITCHDGFTLNDLVSYSRKHNEANGEGNRDGADENASANYGVEGPTDSPFVEAVRLRQIKNFLLTLALSRGVPMLLAGDEFRRGQGGNNNAYCQDNETSWVDWSLLDRHREVRRFVQGILAFRRAHSALRREAFYTGEDIQWLAADGRSPDWSDPRQKSLACLIYGHGESDLYCMFNASPTAIRFFLPPPPRLGSWYLALDTAQPTPRDVCATGDARALRNRTRYAAEPHSAVILVTR